MIRTHFAGFAALTALIVGGLGSACTASTTQVTQDDAGTNPGSSTSSSGHTSSSSSSGHTTSSTSSGGSTSSSGGSTSSSGGSTSSSGGSTSSSGGSSGVVFPKDASAPDANNNTGNTCPDNVALTSADLDAQIGWKAAVAHPGACTATDLTTLQNNFTNPGIATYFDLGNGLSASCQACVLSKDTDANWQPIVGTAADNGATGFVNFGACFGSVEGTACGKSVQYEQFCYNVECNDCTTTTERDQCVNTAGGAGGACAAFGTATATDCPNINTTATTCGTIIDAVKKLCQ